MKEKEKMETWPLSYSCEAPSLGGEKRQFVKMHVAGFHLPEIPGV